MSGLYDQGKVGGKRTTVAGTRSFFVRVRSGHIIRELSGSCEHFALIVGTVGVLDLFSERPSLCSGMRNTDHIAPGDSVKGMARRANFLVDQVAASNAGKDGERDKKVSLESKSTNTSLCIPGMIESIEPTLMTPGIFRRMETIFAWRVCADCSNEGERTIEVSVPCDGSNREEGDRSESSRRRKRRHFLQCHASLSAEARRAREKQG